MRGFLFRLSSGQLESINYVEKVCKILLKLNYSVLSTFVVGSDRQPLKHD